MNIKREIALWGPTGSGKTWLIRSFGKALFNMSNRDPLFNYYIVDASGRRIDIFKTPEVKGTEKPEDLYWLFRREIKVDKNSRYVNCHAHTILLHDARGKALIDLLANAGKDDQEQNIVKMGLQESEHVILMLDFTKLRDSQQQPSQPSPSSVSGSGFSKPASQQSSSSSSPSAASLYYTRAEYTQLVTDILHHLTNPPKPNRRIAICISKIDQLRIQRRDPWKLVEMLFGSDMLAQLQNFRNIMKIEVFPLSAVGYLGPERVPNYDPGTGDIKDPSQWQPDGVEAPFFWLFDYVERERLLHNGEGIIKFLYQATRFQHYENYPSNL